MCGRWYLPTFLFRDGSLSLMYMASFMALIRFQRYCNFLFWWCDQWCYSGHIWGMGSFDVPSTFHQKFWKTHQCTLHYIVRKAEKSLLNERIRSINNTIAMLKMQVYTCIHHLEEKLDKKSMEECYKFIDNKRELRHDKTMKCQIGKFERLQQKQSQIKGGHSK